MSNTILDKSIPNTEWYYNYINIKSYPIIEFNTNTNNISNLDTLFDKKKSRFSINYKPNYVIIDNPLNLFINKLK